MNRVRCFVKYGVFLLFSVLFIFYVYVRKLHTESMSRAYIFVLKNAKHKITAKSRTSKMFKKMEKEEKSLSRIVQSRSEKTILIVFLCKTIYNLSWYWNSLFFSSTSSKMRIDIVNQRLIANGFSVEANAK